MATDTLYTLHMSFSNLAFTHISNLIHVHNFNFPVCFLFPTVDLIQKKLKYHGTYSTFLPKHRVSLDATQIILNFFYVYMGIHFHKLCVIHLWSFSSIYCSTDKESNHMPDKEQAFCFGWFRVQTLVRSSFFTLIQTNPGTHAASFMMGIRPCQG
jgi:hypothetical protein